LLINLGTVNLFGHQTALTFSTQQLIAIAVLAFLSGINILGIRTGAVVQNIFTTLKVGTLLGLIVLGLWWGQSHATAPIQVHGMWQGVRWDLATLTVVSVAMVGPLFSSDSWHNVTFTGAEVLNPKRNLPLALVVGTVTVCTLYFLCNLIYVHVLPFYGSPTGADPLSRGIQYAAEDRVGTAAVQAMLGAHGEGLMAAAIMVSTFGCINGLILAGARVYYAMSKDGLFFKKVGTVNLKYHTPAVSIVVQGVWAALLTLSGTYNDLLDYVIFSVVLFYILTIGGLFWLRHTRPDAPRPYRAWGYPVLPAIYIIFAMFVEWALLYRKTAHSLTGLLIVAVGIPVFYVWRQKGRAA